MFRMGNNLVGPVVKTYRVGHVPPMTQSELAARLQLAGWEISRTGVAKIELGLRRVTDVEVWHLANALGVSVRMLFPDEPHNDDGGGT